MRKRIRLQEVLDRALDYEIDPKLARSGSSLPGFQFLVPKQYWQQVPTVEDFFIMEIGEEGNEEDLDIDKDVLNKIEEYNLQGMEIDEYAISGFFYDLDDGGTIVDFVFQGHFFVEDPESEEGKLLHIGATTEATGVGATSLIFSTVVAATKKILGNADAVRVLTFTASGDSPSDPRKGKGRKKLYNTMARILSRGTDFTYIGQPPGEKLEAMAEEDDFFKHAYQTLVSEFHADLDEGGRADVYVLYR